MNIQHNNSIISSPHSPEEKIRHFYTQNSSIRYCLHGQRQALAPLLPRASTSSPRDLRLRGTPAVAIQSVELRMKASPAPQRGTRPLASRTLLPGDCILSLGWGEDSQKGQGFISLQHSSPLVLFAESPKCKS